MDVKYVVFPDDLALDNPSYLQMQYDIYYRNIVMMQLVYRLDCFYM